MEAWIMVEAIARAQETHVRADGYPLAAATCAFVIIIGTQVVWYAWQGRRELATM